MAALALGLVAALAWGLHDLCVRRVSRRAHIPTCLLVVLGAGALALVPLVALEGWEPATLVAAGVPTRLVGAGALFAAASYALYRAFAAGPVRIVAPLAASYPVATTAFAALGGTPIAASRWVAIGAVVTGVALVARPRRDAPEPPFALPPTVAWSLGAALAFAASFTLGQALAARLDAATLVLATRLAAFGALGLCMALGGAPCRARAAELPLLGLMGVLDAAALGCVLLAGRLPEAVFATVSASLFGVVTIVLARLFLAEPMSARQWAGVGVAFTAIAYLSAE